MEMGKKYKRKDGKPFPFGVIIGIYKGQSDGESWPMFDLGKTRTCIVDGTDDFFELVN